MLALSPKIQSLSEVKVPRDKHKQTQSIDNQNQSIKVLVLDNDHTLGISTSCVASDHFNDAMTAWHQKKGNFLDAHAPLLLEIRKVVPFQSCENNATLKLVQDFQYAGWEVLLMSARPKSMRAVTLKNIQQCGLSHIFNDDNKNIILGAGNKAARTAIWLENHKNWKTAKNINVVLIDDKTSHCAGMIKLPSMLKGSTKAKVESKSYHYVAYVTTGTLTDLQRKMTFNQLLAFGSNKQVPTDAELEKRQFLSEATDDDIYSLAAQISKTMGHPFDSCSNRCKYRVTPAVLYFKPHLYSIYRARFKAAAVGLLAISAFILQKQFSQMSSSA